MLVELNFFFENGTEDRMAHFKIFVVVKRRRDSKVDVPKLTIQHYDGCSDGNALQ